MNSEATKQTNTGVTPEMIVIPYVETRNMGFGDYGEPTWDFQAYTKKTIESVQVTKVGEKDELRNHFNQAAATFMLDQTYDSERTYKSFEAFLEDDIGECEKPRFGIHYWKDDKWNEYDFDEYEVMDFYKQKWSAKTGQVFSDDEAEEAPVLK